MPAKSGSNDQEYSKDVALSEEGQIRIEVIRAGAKIISALFIVSGATILGLVKIPNPIIPTNTPSTPVHQDPIQPSITISDSSDIIAKDKKTEATVDINDSPTINYWEYLILLNEHDQLLQTVDSMKDLPEKIKRLQARNDMLINENDMLINELDKANTSDKKLRGMYDSLYAKHLSVRQISGIEARNVKVKPIKKRHGTFKKRRWIGTEIKFDLVAQEGISILGRELTYKIKYAQANTSLPLNEQNPKPGLNGTNETTEKRTRVNSSTIEQHLYHYSEKHGKHFVIEIFIDGEFLTFRTLTL